MTASVLQRLLVAIWVSLALAGSATGNDDIARVVYIGLDADPYYEPQVLYTGLSLRDRDRPLEALEVAMSGARILSRAIGIKFELEIVLLEDGSDGPKALRTAFDAGALGVLLDLPTEDFRATIDADTSLGPVFNIRHREDVWRGIDCAPKLLHSIPSHAMIADALAQHLRLHGWERVLLLSGGLEQDLVEADAARRAIAKFGLTLADDRKFELTNDPRQRDQSNIALLTGGARHDVVWLVDSVGEFGRYVPFATYDPRPVVGSEGLTGRAWHWTYERHGAPQLNQRFRRQAERTMTSEDYAAWVAVRALIESASRLETVDRDAVLDYLVSDQISLDLYKGVSGSFRGWNGQLRQPILLATHNAVIGVAPYPGYHHRTDTLDTLGVDVQESRCERPVVD